MEGIVAIMRVGSFRRAERVYLRSSSAIGTAGVGS
jgi:hypothetical protein